MERAHAAGEPVATQVNSVAAAREAEAAGVDVIVAQGTEAGGHTGSVGTLPLLQAVLEAVWVPVLAAGGIASARGPAAILAAEAQGAWNGPLLDRDGGEQRAGGTAARHRSHGVRHDPHSRL